MAEFHVIQFSQYSMMSIDEKKNYKLAIYFPVFFQYLADMIRVNEKNYKCLFFIFPLHQLNVRFPRNMRIYGSAFALEKMSYFSIQLVLLNLKFQLRFRNKQILVLNLNHKILKKDGSFGVMTTKMKSDNAKKKPSMVFPLVKQVGLSMSSLSWYVTSNEFSNINCCIV